MSSLKCRIIYKKGVATVVNLDGTPSELYQEALALTGSQDQALKIWSTAYSEVFATEYGVNYRDQYKLDDVLTFLDTHDSLGKRLDAQQRSQVVSLMQTSGIERLSDLSNTLNRIFKKNGILELDPKTALRSKLYTEEDLKDFDIESVRDILEAIDGELVTNDIETTPQDKTSLYDSSKKTVLGTSEKVTIQEIENSLLDAIDDFSNEKEVDAAINASPYSEAVTKELRDKLLSYTRVPVVSILDGELTTDNLDTYTTVSNTLTTEYSSKAINRLEANVRYFSTLSEEVLTEKRDAVVKVLKEVEQEHAEVGIDLVGLSRFPNKVKDVLPLLESTVTMLEFPTEANVRAFAALKDSLITPRKNSVATIVKPAYKGLTVVRLDTNIPLETLYREHQLIKIGENLFHKVSSENTADDLSEALYNKVLDGGLKISTIEDYKLPENKVQVLKDIRKHVLKQQVPGYTNSKEMVVLHQLVFEHLPIKADPRAIDRIGEVTSDINYLKDDFVADFYRMILVEKAKDSTLYRTKLSAFAITDNDISLHRQIDNLDGILMQKELEDYIRIKKDSEMNHLLPASKRFRNGALEAINNPDQVKEYNKPTRNIEDFIVTEPNDKDFIKVNGELYRQLVKDSNASVFAKVEIEPGSYYQTDANKYFNLEDARKALDDSTGMFTPQETTKEDHEQYKKEVGVELKEAPKKATDKQTTQLVAEYLKGKLGMGISILSNSDMRTELAKRGYDSLKAMVQAYHGSPFSFDKFTTSKMGTGEGAQAFGWGLYFTGLEGIAKDYAKKLSQNRLLPVYLKGERISPDMESFLSGRLDDFKNYFSSEKSNKKRFIISEGDEGQSIYLEEVNGVWKRVISEYDEFEDDYTERSSPTSFSDFLGVTRNNYSDELLKEYLGEDDFNFLQKNINLLEQGDKFSPNLYKVTLHEGKTPDQYNWLEWDKSVTKELKDKVRVALNELGINTNSIGYTSTTWVDGKPVETVEPEKDLIGGLETGKDLYEAIAISFDGNLNEIQKKASILLLDLGVDGVKYPAESVSRGATSDTARGFNYVVFDENAISIDEKIQFLAANDKVYGFYDGTTGEIYLTEDFLNSGTLIHEHWHAFKPALKAKANKGDKTAQMLLDKMRSIVDESGVFNEAEFSARYDAANNKSTEWSNPKVKREALNAKIKQAAQELKAGKITNEAFREIVKENSTVAPITEFVDPATEEQMNVALASNKLPKLGAPVEQGKLVGLRLDIPALDNHNTWVVTVHEAKSAKDKGSSPISYTNVARITNVSFNTDPKRSLDIATGDNKNNFIRMNGNWSDIPGESFEDKGQNAKQLVEDIKNNPEWIQVGANPYRHSYFYDRSNEMPVTNAEEVIQIGGLVYAKNVTYGDINSPEFTVKGLKDAAGNPVQFSAENAAYHGGDLSMGIDGPLFVSEDRNQAEAYAEGNNGSIQKFNLNDLNIANEEDLIKILKDNEFTPAEGWTFDELNIHEILDPNFSDTSLSKPELARLYEILSLKGIDAVRFTDSNLQTLKQDINNIVVFNTDKLSNVKMSTTLSSEAYNPRPGESKEDYIDRMREEIEANLLGAQGEEYFKRIAEENNLTEEQAKTFLGKIKDFIKQFSEWLSNQLGFNNLTPEQVANLTTKDAMDRIITTMLRNDTGAKKAVLDEKLKGFIALESIGFKFVKPFEQKDIDNISCS